MNEPVAVPAPGAPLGAVTADAGDTIVSSACGATELDTAQSACTLEHGQHDGCDETASGFGAIAKVVVTAGGQGASCEVKLPKDGPGMLTAVLARTMCEAQQQSSTDSSSLESNGGLQGDQADMPAVMPPSGDEALPSPVVGTYLAAVLTRSLTEQQPKPAASGKPPACAQARVARAHGMPLPRQAAALPSLPRRRNGRAKRKAGGGAVRAVANAAGPVAKREPALRPSPATPPKSPAAMPAAKPMGVIRVLHRAI